MKRNSLLCYCCGKSVGKEFALVALKKEADRVFIVHQGHAKFVDMDAAYDVIRVSAEGPTNAKDRN